MAGFVFNEGSYGLQKGTIHYDSDTIMARLITSATSAAVDIDADFMTGIGSRADQEPTSITTMTTPVGPTKDDAADHVKYTSDNLVFTGAALTIGACDAIVIYKFVEGGTPTQDDAASIPIAKVMITEVTPNGGDITVTLPALGWFYTQQHA